LAISKKRKETLLQEYKETLQSNSALVFTGYAGLGVKELEDLRRKMREIGGEYFIVKNSIAKRAFADVGIETPDGGFDGPTAIGATSEEVPNMLKTMVDLTKESEVFTVRGAIVDGALMSGVEVRQLAELPPMPVLQAQLLSVFNSPATQLASVFAGSVRQLMNVLKAYSESEGEAAAAAS
jgi:large subunit ribosomal protein L10